MTCMTHDDDIWDGRDGGEGRAGDPLSERASRLLDRLTAKLARHNREAEQLADAMRQPRDKA